MTEAERLVQVLERNQYDNQTARAMSQAAALLRSQAAEIEALQKQIANLKTVMIAAAEEIHAHWDAHCDADGYGPQNLMRRLEEGIPSEYGYTAGAFQALRADAERYQWVREHASAYDLDRAWTARENSGSLDAFDSTIDAARNPSTPPIRNPA